MDRDNTVDQPRVSGARDLAMRQDAQQPLVRQRSQPGVFRYLYDRASDSQVNGEPGQDFLAVRHAPGRLVFAVCDGVGASYRGDLAARFLGEQLVDWLWGVSGAFTERTLQAELAVFLRKLTDRGRRFVEENPPPRNVPKLVYDALEQQLAYGSEAMFIAGAVSWPSPAAAGQVAVAWLGDEEFQLVDPAGRSRTFRSKVAERWSTNHGLRGTVHVSVTSAEETARVVAYTDGLISLAPGLLSWSDGRLSREAMALSARPDSDDVALVDVALDERSMPSEHEPDAHTEKSAPPARGGETTPARESAIDRSIPPPRVEIAGTDRQGGVALHWEPVPHAEEYRVQLATVPDGFANLPLEYTVREPSFRTSPAAGKTRYVRVQAVTRGSNSDWSDVVAVTPANSADDVDVAYLETPRFVTPPSNAIVRSPCRLKWTPVRGAERYAVQRATDPSFDPAEVLEGSTTWPDFTLNEEKSGFYYFRVQAQASHHRSEWSAPLTLQFEGKSR